jgi:hypothetical protein
MRKHPIKNENDGAPAGFATLADTPGMGDVTMPTSTSVGSGDVFGGVMDFGSWTKSRRKKRGRKKSRRR